MDEVGESRALVHLCGKNGIAKVIYTCSIEIEGPDILA